MNEGETQCSSCGATVQGPPGAMKCPYCGMRVDIPMSAAQRDAEERAARLAEETDDERRRARMHDRYEDTSEDAPAVPESSNVGTIVGLVVGLAVVGIIIGIVAGTRHAKSTSGVERKKTSAAATMTTTTTIKPKPPTTYDSVLINSCRCAFGDGQSTPLITVTPLAAPTQDPSRPLSLQIQNQFAFSTANTSAALAIPLGTALTPLDGGDLPPHMGVACDTGVYVLVVDRTATGWSSVNAKWKWNVTLPASLVDGADAGAPPQPKNTDFGGYCTPLSVTNGNASIALAGGRRATLSLKDGKLK